MLQKVIPDRRAKGELDEPARHIVDRLFTFATPHGGIAFDVGFGLFEWARDTLGIAGTDMFGPARMWEYLTPEADQRALAEPPEDWDPRVVPNGAFPLGRIFTLVGTNPGDYGAAFGLSSAVVGAESDGLVQIANAIVPGAQHGYVHRSHSGRYGIVNSEEGYQNLRRFLLGDLEVHAALVGFDPPDTDDDLVWQGEVELAVRGLPVLMHDRTAPHHCPIDLTPGDLAIPLGSTALLSDPAYRPAGAGRIRYTLRLSVSACGRSTASSPSTITWRRPPSSTTTSSSTSTSTATRRIPRRSQHGTPPSPRPCGTTTTPAPRSRTT